MSGSVMIIMFDTTFHFSWGLILLEITFGGNLEVQNQASIVACSSNISSRFPKLF